MGKRDFFKKNRFVVSSTQTNAHCQVVVDRAPMSGLPRTPQSSPSPPASFDIPADINATLDWEEEVPAPGLQSKVRPSCHYRPFGTDDPNQSQKDYVEEWVGHRAPWIDRILARHAPEEGRPCSGLACAALASPWRCLDCMGLPDYCNKCTASKKRLPRRVACRCRRGGHSSS